LGLGIFCVFYECIEWCRRCQRAHPGQAAHHRLDRVCVIVFRWFSFVYLVLLLFLLLSGRSSGKPNLTHLNPE
jgi:hypothetical protein